MPLAPSYISSTAVESGALSPTTAINPTKCGNRTEENVVFKYRQPDSDQPMSVNLYGIHSVFNRYATFSSDPLLSIPRCRTEPHRRPPIQGGRKWRPWLPLTGGVRYDRFFFDPHDVTPPSGMSPIRERSCSLNHHT